MPLLAEMPPEGKVGVSESCVLGYNVNMGQEIHLRLRTDDMRGFRVYARIRETLLHELTHNVHGPHDINFKRLCSQLNVECREFDWKRNGAGAQKLGGTVDESDEETWSEDEAMAATRASSGQLWAERAGCGRTCRRLKPQPQRQPRGRRTRLSERWQRWLGTRWTGRTREWRACAARAVPDRSSYHRPAPRIRTLSTALSDVFNLITLSLLLWLSGCTGRLERERGFHVFIRQLLLVRHQFLRGP